MSVDPASRSFAVDVPGTVVISKRRTKHEASEKKSPPKGPTYIGMVKSVTPIVMPPMTKKTFLTPWLATQPFR